MKKVRILLDMDEVLVDFVGGVCKRWGTTPAQVLPYWTVGEWNIIPPLSSALAAKEGVKVCITEKEFWELIEGDEQFWIGLQPTVFAREILDLIESFTDDWHVISSPSHCPSCYDGKVKWLKYFFGYNFNRFAITPHKHLFARSDTILIDDWQSTVEKFIEEGGKGIVFPRHSNNQHANKSDPVAYVTKELERICR